IRGIPVVYEMRGIWEDSHTGRYGLSQTSMRYRGVRGLETIALRNADHCVVIADALRDEVISRGVSPERVAVIPNGVDCGRFTPGEADPDLARGLGLHDSLVMGYIGYFFHYEGLDLLFQAFAALASEFPKLKLLLVGDGELMGPLREMAQESELASRVVFTGRVRHDSILDYYRLFHLLTLPRRLGRESSLVTPLKPLEIMAMGKPLVASDVGGHLEIVQHRVNGLLFKSDSIESLVDACRTVLQDETLRRELGLRARKWVETNRDWNVLVQRYVDLYEKLQTRKKGS
ncbi:MAG: glycosyltransferase family 4 protein, partial [Desulfomonilaceae bacterium]